jgi:hypothetical protein
MDHQGEDRGDRQGAAGRAIELSAAEESHSNHADAMGETEDPEMNRSSASK